MNCTDWEERIALHAEGDLPQPECAAVEQHLAGCAACREFLAELQHSLSALRTAHSEPLDASAFTAVRARVLEEIDHAPRRAWWLVWSGALAATAAVFVTLLLPRPVPPPKMVATPPPAAQIPVVILPPAASAPAKPVSRKRRAAPRPEPLMVKLITDDPDVVIYWITN